MNRLTADDFVLAVLAVARPATSHAHADMQVQLDGQTASMIAGQGPGGTVMSQSAEAPSVPAANSSGQVWNWDWTGDCMGVRDTANLPLDFPHIHVTPSMSSMPPVGPTPQMPAGAHSGRPAGRQHHTAAAAPVAAPLTPARRRSHLW